MIKRVSALSTLFECGAKARFDPELLRNVFGEEIDRLRAGEFLAPASPAKTVTCHECGDVHDVDVEWSKVGGPRRFCVESGWVDVNHQDLQVFSFSDEAFLRALEAALGAARLECVAEDLCWRIRGRGAREDRIVLLARGLNKLVTYGIVVGALAKFRKWRGLLLLCGQPPEITTGLPTNLRIVALDDAVALESSGRLVVDTSLLELSRRGRGEHGGPHHHPALGPLIDQRHDTGASCATPAREATWLLEHPDWAIAGKPMPRPTSLARYIGRRWTKRAATN